MALPTDLQLDRQFSRDGKSGRYTRHHVCEVCDCNARDFCSDDRCNSTGKGLVLCEKCATKLADLDDAAYLAVFGMSLEARKVWKRSKV